MTYSFSHTSCKTCQTQTKPTSPDESDEILKDFECASMNLLTSISVYKCLKELGCVCTWGQCVHMRPVCWLCPWCLADWSQSEWSWYKQAWPFPRLCLHWETPEQHYESTGFPLHGKLTHYPSPSHTGTHTDNYMLAVHVHADTLLCTQ